MLKKLFLAVALTAFTLTGAGADGGNGDKVTLLFESPLPNVAGKSIKGVLVEYAPGGTSPAHTHPSSAFIAATILEGAIRSQVNDGPVTVYKAGETFFEKAGDHHGVSENASKTEPAKLLAVFVVNTDEQVLTTYDPK
jgi:quercetin dioxygenase-like cupin family protein